MSAETTGPAAGGPMEFSGRVTDALSGAGIEGATVTVHRRLIRADDGDVPLVPASAHHTDATGRFHFTLSAEQAAMPLYLEVDVRHPAYAARTGGGYGLSLIRRDLELGQPPWFTQLEMMPGEEVTGVIVDPDGTPLAGVPVRFVSIGGPREERFIAQAPQRADDQALTDESGRFRFNAVKGAAVNELFIKPEQFAALFHDVRDQRGDLGTFRLEHGVPVTGIVLTVDGTPVADVGVRLESIERSGVHWSTTSRHVTTDSAGRYAVAPVKPGAYELKVSEVAESSRGGARRMVSLPGAFLPQHVIVEFVDHNRFPPVEIRAVPHAKVRLQFVDSAGKPTRGWPVHIIAKRDGRHFRAVGRVGDSGAIELRVPRPVTEAKVMLSADPDSALRYRRGENGDLKAGGEIDLGTVDGDVEDLFVVRYRAPTLLIRAISAADSQPIADFRPAIIYPSGTVPPMRGEWLTGLKGEVAFEKHQDGAWRTIQLLPDVPLALTVEAAGFKPEVQQLELTEGETRDVTVALSPASD